MPSLEHNLDLGEITIDLILQYNQSVVDGDRPKDQYDRKKSEHSQYNPKHHVVMLLEIPVTKFSVLTIQEKTKDMFCSRFLEKNFRTLVDP